MRYSAHTYTHAASTPSVRGRSEIRGDKVEFAVGRRLGKAF
jgi:hypothetical protein